MSGGGGEKVTNTTINNTDPWSEAQPYLEKSMSEAESLYDAGVGHNPYNQSLVIPYADATMQGMQGVQDTAGMYQNALQNPMSFNTNMFDTGGLNAAQQTSLGQLGYAAQGNPYNAQSQQGVNSLQNMNTQLDARGGLSPAQQASLQQSAGLAAGNELYGSNPGFQRNLREAQNDAMNSVNEQAMKAGRYSSGAHQGVMADRIGDLTANMYSNEYGRQLGRQDAARGEQFQMGQQGLGNRTSSAKDLFGAGNTGYGNQYDAVMNQFNAGQQGTQNMFGAAAAMPSDYSTASSGYRDMMGIGSMYEDLATREANDQLRRYNEADMEELNRLAQYNSLIGGAGKMGSSTTNQTISPTASPFQAAAGGAMTGLASGGTTGAMIGGGLGLLGSLF